MATIIQNFPTKELEKKGPALLRCVEAWYFSLAAYASSIDNGANAPQPSIWVSGKDASKEAGCLVAYAADSSTLVLAFDGGLPLVIRSLQLHYSKEKLSTQRPVYLNPEDGLGDDAEVVIEYNSCFSSLLPGIETAISRLVPTGKAPLKVLCTGFCMGGGLAVLTAPWTALKWPNSDISCITFGAPIIGNPGFNKSFNVLVGLSYRGIYRLDPVPDMRPFNKLSIKLCATGDDFYFDGHGSSRTLHPHRPLLTLHHNLSDHTTAAYDQGITAAVENPSPGIPATPDGRAVLVDPVVAKQIPELAERGDCTCAQSCPCGTAPGTETVLCRTSGSDSRTVLETDVDNFKEEGRRMEKQQQEPKNVVEGNSHAEMNNKLHTPSSNMSHAEAGTEHSCLASSSSFANFSCFSCLFCFSSVGPGGGGGSCDRVHRDPRSVHLDQFWKEMHLQAEAMRQSSPEVMAYMKQVFSGKKAEPPEIVQTAMAAAVRLGEQSYGDPCCSGSGADSTTNKTNTSSGSCGEQAAVELPFIGSTRVIEKNRIKKVTARRLALPATCANASYLSTAEQFSSATKIKHVTHVRDPRTEATVFIGWIPDESSAVLSFRGTASRSDAYADLKFLPRQIEFLPELFPGATAHLGFLTHFTGLTSATDEERNIATALLKLTGGKTPARVICTGHSLGGALACLGGAWAALQFPTAEIRCITFGAPRVGNSRFIRAFKTLVGIRMRVVHGADPVPALPPPLKYSHFQPAVFLRRNGTSLEWKPEGWQRHLALALSDHHMLKYISSVAAVLDAKEVEGKEAGAVEGETDEIKGKMAAAAAAVMRAPWTWLQALVSSEV